MSNIAGSDPLRVLIVGCGKIAGGFDAARPDGAPPLTHAGAYRATRHYQLAGCVDPDEARRLDFMRRWDVAEGYADLDAALSYQSYDVVSICSPTEAHGADLRAVLASRPKAVFCEKPVTSDAASTAKLVTEYEAAGIPLAINHTRRWDPAVTAVGEALAKGEWGRVRSVIGIYSKGVLNNGSHLVDLIHLLLGEVRVVSVGEPIRDFWEDDPSVPALLTTGDGIAVHLACGNAADFALFELHLVLERGVLSMEEGGMAWRERKVHASPVFSGYRTVGEGNHLDGGYEGAMLRAVENIHAAVIVGAPLVSTGRSALAAQAICEALMLRSKGLS